MSPPRTYASLGLQESGLAVGPPITSNSVLSPALDADTVRWDALATRIVVPRGYPELVERFLDHKRRHGSAVERALYGHGRDRDRRDHRGEAGPAWTWRRQVARLVRDRPLVFMGPRDYTLLRDGTRLADAAGAWDRVGTDAEGDNNANANANDASSSSSLRLRHYLSYDEMMLGSLLAVSGPSCFVNDGARHNRGRPAGASSSFAPRGIVVGLVGARFERDDRMDAALLLPPPPLPAPHHRSTPGSMHPELRSLFRGFFAARSSPSSSSATTTTMTDDGFDVRLYKGRMRAGALDLLLLEAADRARAAGAGVRAHVYLVGLGLGAWLRDARQAEWLVEALVDAVEELAPELGGEVEANGSAAAGQQSSRSRSRGRSSRSRIGTLELAWFPHLPSRLRERLTRAAESRLGARVLFTKENPAAARQWKPAAQGQEEEQLLVVSYAWDGNAFPGNEYWAGMLDASGDPAAACMSTIAELHNPYINPRLLNRIQTFPPPEAWREP
ncbi:hypothetical protein GGR56DRAFT_689217 [Xylariaceae sp. FL0804]|nr:hypothetical protein GGR56DRAFT_689217 [Xylariaceae sp. FL0804]